MKFTVATLVMALATASAKTKKVDMSSPLAADSKAGLKVLSQARRVEENGEVDFTWVAGYSLKFQGCHHMQQWNAEADGEDEPKIQTKRLVRFRLCPSDSCTYADASGCSSGYGDYIIDLNIFLEAYWENKLEMQEWQCEYTRINECGCDDDDGKDDNFNEESCQYACFMDRGMDYCWEGGDPDADDEPEEQEELEVQEYMECAQIDFPEDENRRLEEEEEIQYFIGPYCADSGAEILLGVFNDEFCTNFASEGDAGRSVYYDYMGEALPYSSESLVDMNCIPCKEPGDADMQNNQNDQQDEDEVVEMCEMVYEQAGKCENNLGINNANNNGCNYMDGISIFRRDGQVIMRDLTSSSAANVFIGLFAATFAAAGAYAYYLKTKLDRAKINLSE